MRQMSTSELLIAKGGEMLTLQTKLSKERLYLFMAIEHLAVSTTEEVQSAAARRGILVKSKAIPTTFLKIELRRTLIGMRVWKSDRAKKMLRTKVLKQESTKERARNICPVRCNEGRSNVGSTILREAKMILGV